MSGLTQNLSELRKLLQPYENKNNKLAFFLWVSDYFIFFFGQYCVVVLPASLKIIGSVITVIAIGKLFILGHDACHGALTSSKRLNYWLAQIAFLPAMTSFTGWNKWHNVIHHGFTNLVGNDAWQTLSSYEYDKLSKFRKLQYQFYQGSTRNSEQIPS